VTRAAGLLATVLAVCLLLGAGAGAAAALSVDGVATVESSAGTVGDAAGSNATAPWAGSYAPGSYGADGTTDADTAIDVTTVVGDVGFASTRATLQRVTLDPAAGANSSTLDANDVDSLYVATYAGGDIQYETKRYRGSPVTLNFTNRSGVTRIRVLALIADTVEDGDVIDLGIEAEAAEGTLRGTGGLYDTAGEQTALVPAPDGFVSVEVRDPAGNPITDGSVVLREVGSSAVVANSTLNDRGESERLRVSTGTYKLTVGAPGYETASFTVNVGPNETVDYETSLVGSCDLSSFVLRYDGDGNCAISLTELGKASADFANGNITLTQLGQVSTAFANS